MSEIILEVTGAPEGGFTARALRVSIYTLSLFARGSVMRCGPNSTTEKRRP